MNGDKEVRKAVTQSEVKAFKQAWYHAITTGQSTPMTFSGNRSETITSTTQPHEVGIKDVEQIKQIIAFKNLVYEYNLLLVTSSKWVSLLDDVNINVIAQFIEDGIVESIDPFGAGNIVTIQTRIDEATKRPITSPVLLCKVKFNRLNLGVWLEETKLGIETQIAEEVENVH